MLTKGSKNQKIRNFVRLSLANVSSITIWTFGVDYSQLKGSQDLLVYMLLQPLTYLLEVSDTNST